MMRFWAKAFFILLPIPALMCAGMFLNAWVVHENADRMPVFADVCRDFGGLIIDSNHACASGAVRLAGLADWILAGVYIYSPGDLLMAAAEWYILAALVLLLVRIGVTMFRENQFYE
jgi:hypothetical protein